MSRSTAPQRSATDCACRPPSGIHRHQSEAALKPRRSSNFYGWLDRHAHANIHIGRAVEDDLDRDALDDLHEIAGGILGRKQAEDGSPAILNAVDMGCEGAPRIGIDRDLDRLPRPHFGELRLLEIGRDPRIARNEYHQSLSG